MKYDDATAAWVKQTRQVDKMQVLCERKLNHEDTYVCTLLNLETGKRTSAYEDLLRHDELGELAGLLRARARADARRGE
eukprot:5317823-Pyramimonas_sp.AAC.1